MTFEAGLTKVSYLLGRTDLTLEQKKLVRVFIFTSGLHASYQVVSFLLRWIILSMKLKQRPLSFQNIGLNLLQILNTSDEWHCVSVLYNWSFNMEEARLLVGTISISFMVIISSWAFSIFVYWTCISCAQALQQNLRGELTLEQEGTIAWLCTYSHAALLGVHGLIRHTNIMLKYNVIII